MMLRSITEPALACCAFMLAACEASSTALLEPPLDDAIAYVQVADPLSAYARAQFGIPMAPIKLPGRSRCPFVASSSRFECPDAGQGTLTNHQAYQLLGENNNVLDAWDAKVVVAIKYFSEIKGRVATAKGPVDFHRQEEATLSNLRELRQTLTGVVNISWSDGVASFTGQRRSELQLMARNRMPGVFPIGRIEASLDGVAPTSKTSGNITFDGSASAQLMLSFAGQPTVRCSVDLQSAEPFPGCR